jgi:hypothetical protein
MIEPRCPECTSPEIEPDPQSTSGRWRCGNCGERFDYEAAFIQLREAVDFLSAIEPERLFDFQRDLAEAELRAGDGALRVLDPHSDAQELHRALDAAIARRVIRPPRQGAALHAYLPADARAHPVLGVDRGAGPELIGPSLGLRRRRSEDPISYTVRWLGQIVDDANDLLLAAQLHGASGRVAVVDAGSDGPQSHRPPPARGPQRHFVAVAYWIRPDATMGETFLAEGRSILSALVGAAERIELADFHPKHALRFAVMWKDEADVGGEEATP